MLSGKLRKGGANAVVGSFSDGRECYQAALGNRWYRWGVGSVGGRPSEAVYLGGRAMEWFSRKTSIAGSQISNWILVLALLWQIYSRRCFSLICLLQYGHRCGRGRTMSSTMAWRTAGRLG